MYTFFFSICIKNIKMRCKNWYKSFKTQFCKYCLKPLEHETNPHIYIHRQEMCFLSWLYNSFLFIHILILLSSSTSGLLFMTSNLTFIDGSGLVPKMQACTSHHYYSAVRCFCQHLLYCSTERGYSSSCSKGMTRITNSWPRPISLSALKKEFEERNRKTRDRQRGWTGRAEQQTGDRLTKLFCVDVGQEGWVMETG